MRQHRLQRHYHLKCKIRCDKVFVTFSKKLILKTSIVATGSAYKVTIQGHKKYKKKTQSPLVMPLRRSQCLSYGCKSIQKIKQKDSLTFGILFAKEQILRYLNIIFQFFMNKTVTSNPVSRVIAGPLAN